MALRGHPSLKQQGTDKPYQQRFKRSKDQPCPSVEIDEATEIILCARQNTLEAKKYTTCEDDFELSLLKDPELRLYASRITYLSFKENKTAREKYELELYENPESRPFANHIMELIENTKKNKYEKLELNYLTNPILRPYAADFFQLLRQKTPFTQREQRQFNLSGDAGTFKNAKEIANLEAINHLSQEQVQMLSNDYLYKLANIPVTSKNNFQTNDTVELSNSFDCYKSDANNISYDAEMTKFKSIENAFSNAAERLLQRYFKQVMSDKYCKSSLMTNSFFNKGKNGVLESIVANRKASLTLALEKIFFDYNIPFTNDHLQQVTEILENAIMNKQLHLNTTDYKDLENLMLNVTLKERVNANTLR